MHILLYNNLLRKCIICIIIMSIYFITSKSMLNMFHRQYGTTKSSKMIIWPPSIVTRLNRLIMVQHSLKHTIRSDSILSSKAQLICSDVDSIQKAALILKNGGLVAFPTETVYGLGANAFNATAVQSIFTTKKRPNSDPLIVHVKNKELMFDLFDFTCGSITGNNLVRSICEILIESFWPGPLTIIYKANSKVPSEVTANTGYVGVRCPNHPIALKLLDAVGDHIPIAAPSANRFGHVSPTTSAHVLNDLGDSPITVIEDDADITGGCKIGIESTVCRIRILSPRSSNTNKQYNIASNGEVGDEQVAEISILRCGAITSTLITKALHDKGIMNCIVKIDNQKHLQSNSIHHNSSNHHSVNNILTVNNNINSQDGFSTVSDSNDIAVAPGQMIRHYAPDLPTYIAIINDENNINPNPTTSDRSKKLNNNQSVNIANKSNAMIVNNEYKDIGSAAIIDYGGRLQVLKNRCKSYSDLSPENNVNDACYRLFNELRKSESQEMLDIGVTNVLLPDLRYLFDAQSDDNQLVDCINSNSIHKNNHNVINNINEIDDNDSSITNSQEQSIVSNDGLERALWERINRAASSTYVYIPPSSS